MKIFITIVFISIAITGCGLTAVQKQQVSQFATSTESISKLTQDQYISMYEKVVDMERRRLIMRKEVPPASFDLDGGLTSSGIATQISALKALQAYGNVLKNLAVANQSDEISKSATNFLTQFETAMQLDDSQYTLESDKKESIIGIVNIANTWFVENKKKKSIKKIVDAYSSEVSDLASLIRNDITLTGYSLCLEAKDRHDSNVRTGVIDIYCTSADGLKEASKDVLSNKNYSFSEREFAYNSYVISEKVILEVRELSSKGSKLVDNLIKANEKLTKVIESDDYTTDDITDYAKSVQEVVTLTKVLTGK